MDLFNIIFCVAGTKSVAGVEVLKNVDKTLITPHESQVLTEMLDIFKTSAEFPSYSYLSGRYGTFERLCKSTTDMKHALTELYKQRQYSILINKVNEVCVSTTDPIELKEKLSVSLMSANVNKREMSGYVKMGGTYSIRKSKISGYQTGVKELEEITNGWQPGLVSSVCAWTSHGKSCRMDTKFRTMNGFILNRDVKLGDGLIDSEGGECYVTGVFPQGVRDLYRVWFDDGTFVDCDLEHLWETQNYKERDDKTFSVKTTKEIMKQGVWVYAHGSHRRNHSIKLVKPVNYPKKKLYIDPYLLGLYLADGSWKSSCSIGLKDEKSLNRIKSCVRDLGDKLSLGQHKENVDFYYIVRNIRKYNTPSNFTRMLRELGLENKHADDKFIPKVYLLSNVDDRMALLQGLCDGDGSVLLQERKGIPTNRIEYGTNSDQLAQDILELVRSLGGKAILYNKEKVNKRIVFSLPKGMCPVYSKQRMDRFGGVRKSLCKYIDKIEKIGREEVQCITVDSKDHLFVVNDFVLTHNSMYWDNAAYLNRKIGKFTAKLSLEIPKEMVYQQQLSRHSFDTKKPIFYEDVFKGRISPDDEKYFFGELEESYMAMPGGFMVLEEHDFSSFSYDGIYSTLQQVEETMGGLDWLTVDHVNLFQYIHPPDPRIRMTGDDYVKIFADIAKTYKNKSGSPIGVGLAVQANRDGWRRAVKNEGRYTMLALSEFREVERSSTYVSFIFADQHMMKVNEMKIHLQKNRIGRTQEDPSLTYVFPACSVVGESFNSSVSQENMDAVVEDFFGSAANVI